MSFAKTEEPAGYPAGLNTNQELFAGEETGPNFHWAHIKICTTEPTDWNSPGASNVILKANSISWYWSRARALR